ncbi:MAG: LexA family protein, partial [Anaerolineales bacterium]
ALQMGYISEAAELLRLAPFDIGRDKSHFFAVINWMEGCVAWIRPRNRHDFGMNRWQTSIDLFKDLSESSGVGVAYLNWYKVQRRIMIEALEFAIENDRLPPVWLILENLGIDDPDFAPGAAQQSPTTPPPPKQTENYFDLFVVYEEIPAGMPAATGHVPTTKHPVHPGLEPDDHIEVTRVRVGGREYALQSLGLRGRKINLAQEAEHFVLRVRGNSMNQAGIENGDLVLCRAQRTARHEDIAAIAFDLNHLDLKLAQFAPLEKLRMSLGPDGELPTTLKRYLEQDKDISIRAESDDPLFDGFDITIPKKMLASQEHIIIYGVAVAVLKPV